MSDANPELISRVTSLENDVRSLTTSFVALRTEMKVRDEQQEKRADRDAASFTRALLQLETRIVAQVAERTQPLAAILDTQSQAEGVLKTIRLGMLFLGGVIVVLGGWSVVFGWGARMIVAAGTHAP